MPICCLRVHFLMRGQFIVKLNSSLEAQRHNNESTQDKLTAIQATQQKIKAAIDEQQKERAKGECQILLKVIEIIGAAATSEPGLYVVPKS